MKRWICLALLLFICLGCQKRKQLSLEEWLQPNGKVKVLSTTAIVDDIVGQIGGDKIDRVTLIGGALDPHSYELVKGDDEKLSYAQIIFHHGLELEHGASLRNHLERHPHTYALGEMVAQKRPEVILHDRGAVDPHIWLDVSLWVETVDPIVRVLSEFDPLHHDSYKSNGERVKERLVQLDQCLKNKLHDIAVNKRYLVTSHDAFNYFARRYLSDQSGDWKERFCAPEGLAPDGQLSCRDIQNVVEHLCEHGITMIFPESNLGRDALKKIIAVCGAKGMKVDLSPDCLYADTLGEIGSPADTYENMMKYNVETLCRAWK